MKFVTIPDSFSEKHTELYSVLNGENHDDIKIKKSLEDCNHSYRINVFSETVFNLDTSDILIISFSISDYCIVGLTRNEDIDFTDIYEKNLAPKISFNSFGQLIDSDSNYKIVNKKNINYTDIISMVIIESKDIYIYKNGNFFMKYTMDTLEPEEYRLHIACYCEEPIKSNFMNGRFYLHEVIITSFMCYYENFLSITSNGINKTDTQLVSKKKHPKNFGKKNTLKYTTTAILKIFQKELPHVIKGNVMIPQGNDWIYNLSKEYNILEFPSYQIKIKKIADEHRLIFKLNKKKRKESYKYFADERFKTLALNGIPRNKYNHIICPDIDNDCDCESCYKCKSDYKCPGIKHCKYWHPYTYDLSVMRVHQIREDPRYLWSISKNKEIALLSSEQSIEHASINTSMDAVTKELNKMEKRLHSELKSRRNELHILQEQNKILATEPDQLKEMIAVKEEEINVLTCENQSRIIETNTIKQQLTELLSENKKLLKMNEKYKEYTKIKSQLKKKENENDKLAKNIEKLQKQLLDKDEIIARNIEMIKDRDEWNAEKKEKITKLSGFEKECKTLRKSMEEYEQIIMSLKQQVQSLSTRDIEIEIKINPKNNSRIKIEIDGSLYDEKHPKWRKSDSKILNLFNTSLHDSRKIHNLIAKTGWKFERHSNHIVYVRGLLNGMVQRLICPSSPSEWQSTWVQLKKLEQEKIEIELS